MLHVSLVDACTALAVNSEPSLPRKARRAQSALLAQVGDDCCADIAEPCSSVVDLGVHASTKPAAARALTWSIVSGSSIRTGSDPTIRPSFDSSASDMALRLMDSGATTSQLEIKLKAELREVGRSRSTLATSDHVLTEHRTRKQMRPSAKTEHVWLAVR